MKDCDCTHALYDVFGLPDGVTNLREKFRRVEYVD